MRCVVGCAFAAALVGMAACTGNTSHATTGSISGVIVADQPCKSLLRTTNIVARTAQGATVGLLHFEDGAAGLYTIYNLPLNVPLNVNESEPSSKPAAGLDATCQIKTIFEGSPGVATGYDVTLLPGQQHADGFDFLYEWGEDLPAFSPLTQPHRTTPNPQATPPVSGR
jgi:hypothetical protein